MLAGQQFVMPNEWPFVTVIIPVYNEERYIGMCLDSVVANDYPKDRLEVLVVDGMSTDRSREIVMRYIEQYPFIRLLDNPRRIVPAALNLGIREARGEIIVRMDAHTAYAPDYIRQCVRLLMTTDAANVGGPMRKVGTTYVSEAIAAATTTPFAAGDAYFHYADSNRWVDTVYLGAWRCETLEILGGFNEELEANEDYELNYRLREMGGRILLSPQVRCWYYVRSSVRALARQYFRYGFWKVKTLRIHPDSIRWRQLVPHVFVLGLSSSLLILPFHPLLGAFLPGLYLIANLVASIWTAATRGWKYFPVLPVIFATVHVSWGLGFLVGLLRWGVPRFSIRSLVNAFRPVGR